MYRLWIYSHAPQVGKYVIVRSFGEACRLFEEEIERTPDEDLLSLSFEKLTLKDRIGRWLHKHKVIEMGSPAYNSLCLGKKIYYFYSPVRKAIINQNSEVVKSLVKSNL